MNERERVSAIAEGFARGLLGAPTESAKARKPQKSPKVRSPRQKPVQQPEMQVNLPGLAPEDMSEEQLFVAANMSEEEIDRYRLAKRAGEIQQLDRVFNNPETWQPDVDSVDDRPEGYVAGIAPE